MKRIIVNFAGFLVGAGEHLDFWKRVRLTGVKHAEPLTEKNLIRNISLDISTPSWLYRKREGLLDSDESNGHFESGSVGSRDFG